MNRTRLLIWGGVGVLAVAAVVIAVVASGGSGGDGSGSAAAHQQAPVKVQGQALPPFQDSVDDAAVGKQMPTLSGVSIFDGAPLTIKSTGKPMAIVFLAHWCPHCQAEVPRLVALRDAGKLVGIDVVGVATATNVDAPNYPPSSWLRREHWPYPVLADSTGFAAAHAFGVTGFPGFVLVDGSGKVLGRSAGEVTDADIVANVSAMREGKPLPLLTPGASSSAG